MCECICSDIREDVVLQVGETTICIDAYPGCRECAQLFGIDVRFFNPQGRKDWLASEPKEVTPDEHGVLPTAASFEIFHIEDIAKVMDEQPFPKRTHWASIGDWFRDYGLEILQEAFRACQERKRTDTPTP